MKANLRRPHRPRPPPRLHLRPRLLPRTPRRPTRTAQHSTDG